MTTRPLFSTSHSLSTLSKLRLSLPSLFFLWPATLSALVSKHHYVSTTRSLQHLHSLATPPTSRHLPVLRSSSAGNSAALVPKVHSFISSFARITINGTAVHRSSFVDNAVSPHLETPHSFQHSSSLDRNIVDTTASARPSLVFCHHALSPRLIRHSFVSVARSSPVFLLTLVSPSSCSAARPGF